MSFAKENLDKTNVLRISTNQWDILSQNGAANPNLLCICK